MNYYFLQTHAPRNMCAVRAGGSHCDNINYFRDTFGNANDQPHRPGIRRRARKKNNVPKQLAIGL